MGNKHKMNNIKWFEKLEEEDHWNSYWIQQKLIDEYVEKNEKILEIGIGSKFCSNYLRNKGHSITTLDFNKEQNPDIVANISTERIIYNYDVILGFEVFEHISWKDFAKILSQMKKDGVRKIILSIPESKYFLLNLTGNFLNLKINLHINIPINKLPKPIRNRYKLWREHKWEMNYSNKYTYKKLEDLFSKNRFIISHYRKSKVNNHVFFVLSNIETVKE